jgi:hypothetical protein
MNSQRRVEVQAVTHKERKKTPRGAEDVAERLIGAERVPVLRFFVESRRRYGCGRGALRAIVTPGFTGEESGGLPQ